MNKNLFILCLSLFVISCTSKDNFKLVIKNDSDFDREEELLEIPVADIEKRISLSKSQVYNVLDAEGAVIPSQITHDKLLIFQPNLKSKESKAFEIVASDSVRFEKLVDVKFRAERYDDMAWENDKLGFRFYGKALEAIQAPMSGLDIWCKRTSRLVLDEWYPNDISGKASYHVDHGEGADFYPVGRTLGAGSMSPYFDGALQLNSNYISHEILDNGPLRVSFRLTYPSINVKGKELSESKEVRLDAGSYLTEILQTYNTEEETDTFMVAAGFAFRGEETPIIRTNKLDYLIYHDPAVKSNGELFLGLIIPQGIEENFVDTTIFVDENGKETGNTKNVLALTTYKPATGVRYYVGFGWDKAGCKDIESFETYLSNYSRRLKEPFILKYQD